MIVNINPTSTFDETAQVLRYASQARLIQEEVQDNSDSTLSLQQQLATANMKLNEALSRNAELEDERVYLSDQLEDIFARFEEEFREAMMKQVGVQLPCAH